MKKFFAYFICFLSFVMFFGSCKGDGNPNPIPNSTVNFIIDLNSSDSRFTIGTMKTFNNTRGYTGYYGSVGGGVVVLRMGDDEFLAYDMACPNDHYYYCFVAEFQGLQQDMPQHFECSCCKAKFNILNGVPISSPKKYAMKKYQVTPVKESFSPVTQRYSRFLVHN
jgi:nitrite reductase/ring-hydroxylating ferredoxin subunit